MFARMVLSLATVAASAQTTQGLIGGRVVDRDTGAGLQAAQVEYFRWQQGVIVEKGLARTNAQGYYGLSFLSPGTYQLRLQTETPRAEVKKYQPQEIYDLELFVAARLEVNFALRPIDDVWTQRVDRSRTLELSTSVIVHYYAADVATLRSAYIQLVPAESSPMEATVSYVVDPFAVENLPLAGRDIYSTLVLEPGVTVDSATSRGLGLSINGQRPTSSNYLLDGVENNNHFLTGPLTVISPEAMQEYRVSTNNFSAEYGRTGGFLANAVTRAGGNRYHGLVFGYLGNDILNANSFERNAKPGEPRLPDKELHAGYQVGGPIRKNRLFFSNEFEQFRNRSFGDTVNYCAPAPNITLTPGSEAAYLLGAFPQLGSLPPKNSLGCGPSAATYQLAPPVSVDRSLGLGRLDYYSPDSRDRWMFRAALARGSRPDFVVSPYQGFNSRLSEDSTGLAVRYVRSLANNKTNELRLGWTNFDLHWNRPHPEIPMLTITGTPRALLPGSELSYAFADRENDFEASDTLSTILGRHVIAAGGGVLGRRPRSVLSYGRDGQFVFTSLAAFVRDMPSQLNVAIQFDPAQPVNVPFQQPRFDRSYSNQQFYLFAQDNYRLSSQLGVSVGVRYESFGTLTNGGPADLSLASVQTAPWMASQRPFQPDRADWAVRLGLNYRIANAVFRAGYGTFYDRAFDNLLQNTRLNNVSNQTFGLCPGTRLPKYLNVVSQSLFGRSLDDVADALSCDLPDVSFPSHFWFIDPHLKAPRVQSWFAGWEYPIAPNLTLEVNHLGAVSHNLIANDVVNRAGPGANAAIPVGIDYLSNSASSNYLALASLLRYRASHGQFQVAYTWSHSIDEQSDPLAGSFLDIGAATLGGAGTGFTKPPALFTEQGNPRADRGNSDFDQRHNLVFYSIWDLQGPNTPGRLRWLLSGWQFAQLGGFRSGLPVSVYYSTDARPDLKNSAYAQDTQTSIPGVFAILNPAAFTKPVPGSGMNLGRNAITGPGFWNVDLSIARAFPLHVLGDAGKLQLRADFFNAFNHANLGAPNTQCCSGAFGQAYVGEPPLQAGFPPLIPLSGQQRQVQLQLKVFF